MTGELEDHEIAEAFGETEDIDGPDSELPSLDDMDAEQDTDTVEPSDYTQQLLLSYLISAPELWVKCAPLIDAKYFDPQYRPVINKITEHLKKYKDMPNPDIIHAATGVKLTFRDDAKEESRQSFVCDQVEEFCRTTAFHDFLVHASEVTASDRSRGTLASLMKDAANIERMSLIRNMGTEIHGGAVPILTRAEESDNQSTGFSHMDRAFSGGLTMPSFNIVSAASGDGKSIYLQNQIVNYVEQGRNCIFYTLELEPAIVIKRFSAMMTNTDIAQVYNHLDTIGHALHTRGKTDGDLWVVKFPMIGTSMSDIAAHYQELTMHTGLNFPCVAIDYIDIMEPDQKVDKSNIHMKDKFVSEEMNDWAHENNIILWSASQQTKGAQDEKDPRQSGVAGGAPKINTCDNLIIGKRSEDDHEDERWWAHVAKARSSGATKAKVPLHWDSRTQRMSDGDRDLFEKSNPKIFGFKRPAEESRGRVNESVKNDPIVKELGIQVKEEEEKSGSSKNAVEAFAKLRSLHHPQQELVNNDETE